MIKSSRADSRVSCLKKLLHFSDPLSLRPQGTVITLLLRMEPKWVSETSEVFKQLTRLSACWDFIQLIRREILRRIWDDKYSTQLFDMQALVLHEVTLRLWPSLQFIDVCWIYYAIRCTDVKAWLTERRKVSHRSWLSAYRLNISKERIRVQVHSFKTLYLRIRIFKCASYKWNVVDFNEI
jgi:hypothetical protein